MPDTMRRTARSWTHWSWPPHQTLTILLGQLARRPGPWRREAQEFLLMLSGLGWTRSQHWSAALDLENLQRERSKSSYNLWMVTDQSQERRPREWWSLESIWWSWPSRVLTFPLETQINRFSLAPWIPSLVKSINSERVNAWTSACVLHKCTKIIDVIFRILKVLKLI